MASDTRIEANTKFFSSEGSANILAKYTSDELKSYEKDDMKNTISSTKGKQSVAKSTYIHTNMYFVQSKYRDSMPMSLY